MKTILLIFAVALSSCSNDSEERTQQANCNCETVLSATRFTLPSGATMTYVTLENDCTGAQRQEDFIGVYTVGQKICN